MTTTEVRSNGHGGRPGTTAPHDQRHGDFVNALQDAVRENPISAALVGMGVLWMFMGGSNTSLFGGGGRKSIFRTAMQGAEQVGDAVRDTAEHVGSSVSRTANVAAGTASQVTDAVRQASAVVGDTASRTAGQAADAVSSAYGATTDVASRAAETISNATMTAATELQNTGAKWGSTVQQNLSDLLDRQPLLLGAIGLAIGAGIASSIPTTEAEKKVMGETSDFIRDTVTEKAAQVKDMADAALQEVKAQGLTPEATGKALHALGEKVSAIVQAATGQPGQERGGSA
jgi:hypothetical protein